MGRKAKDDQRSFTQRRAAALVGLASQSLDAGFQMPSARIRPHLTITMDYTTLNRLAQASGPLTPNNGPGAAFGAGAVVDEATWARQWKPGEDHVISTKLDHDALVGIAPATLPDGTPIPPKVLAR